MSAVSELEKKADNNSNINNMQNKTVREVVSNIVII